MDEIAELRNALERLQNALDDLVVRGVRAAGAAELARLTSLRDEFRSAGAEHLAVRLSTLIDTLATGSRSSAANLLRAMTAMRLFERMLTLEVAAGALTARADDEDVDEEDE
jgi:methylthioribose-1-phosphate isomerase